MVKIIAKNYMKIGPLDAGESRLPGPNPVILRNNGYMLYAHIPFCERLCPYCSFNRFPFDETRARAYFKALRTEMRRTAELGYDFDSMYVGGGTPTIMMDELCQTIDLARELFSIKEVSCETNPNHLTADKIELLAGRVQRLSCGVQSFCDPLLKQMDRYDKYGDGMTVLRQLQEVAAAGVFESLNADMIFNFPSQSEDDLIYDLAAVLESGVNQVTFYPLMASPAVQKSLAATVGVVSYEREQRYYEIISEVLTGDGHGPYRHGSAWTFNAVDAGAVEGTGGLGGASPALGITTSSSATDTGSGEGGMIDEYIVDYEEYPAIGSGGFSYLNGKLYANTFSIDEYVAKIEAGDMSVSGKAIFSKTDRMRYRLMMQLFGGRLDKLQWYRDFGCSVAEGLPAEELFYRMAGAMTDEGDAYVITPKGRYLLVALMREFFIAVNGVRDQARASLPEGERELLFSCLQGAGIED
jgi:coproporphyrinogen III oxidase-like Fe-S oxidoreductase